MIGKRYKIKTGIVFLMFFVLMMLLAYRLFAIQVIGFTQFDIKAQGQHQLTIKLEPTRGDIYDRNGAMLAASVPMPSLYADPKEISDPQEAARLISPIISINTKTLSEKFLEDKRFVWIKRKMTLDEKEKIVLLKIKGLYFQEEPTRFYPNNELAAHILGFVNIDNLGLEGIELEYNDYLQGKPGLRVTEVDAKKQEVLSLRNKDVPPVNGYSLVLSIDEVIQFIVEKELDNAMDSYHPIAATALVMDCATGEVLALANRPAYNPNKFKLVEPSEKRNRAVTDCFEPGSVMKMLTAAGALQEGLFNLNSTIFCENGAYAVSGGVLHDHNAYGTLTFKQVIEKSSNVGIAKVGQKLGPERLYKYLSDFGIGKQTGILIPGEASGVLHPIKNWSGMSITRIPMGHEVSCTAIQLATAACAVANGGKLMKPIIIKRIVDNEDRVVKEYKPEVVRQVISEDTANKLKVALQGVVSKEGTASRAALTGYTAGGKTGTAQKINPDGTYSHSDFVASFVGFTPVKDSKVVIAVVLDAPKPAYYGGVTAAPMFKSIAEKTLSYLNEEPDVKEEKQ